MRLYIPTCTLNFNNILSSESISPLGFYARRGLATNVSIRSVRTTKDKQLYRTANTQGLRLKKMTLKTILWLSR